jgi:hypothetical protein
MDDEGRIQQSIARDPIYTLYLYDDAEEDHAVYASMKICRVGSAVAFKLGLGTDDDVAGSWTGLSNVQSASIIEYVPDHRICRTDPDRYR